MSESRDASFRAPMSTIVAVALAIAALYFAKEILLPIALAALLSFLLTPLVNRLERVGLGRVPAVVATVFMVFALLSVIGWVLLNQLFVLSNDLPLYRRNLIEKVRSVRQAGDKLEEVKKTIEEVGKELTEDSQGDERSDENAADRLSGRPDLTSWLSKFASQGGKDGSEDDAVEVKVIQMPPSPLAQISDWLGPVVAPVTGAAMVVILLIFMLVQREDTRDRVIQLFGTSHLHTTTEALNDAASRVSRYLRMNLAVNTCYGVGVAGGLYFIGLPNAFLWGVLGTLLRFLPYLGPWIAAVMPILLSMAVFDGWWTTVMVVGLFIVLELLVNNVLEPLLYGSSVGISSLGIVVAAIFWTWLWGPIGLVLAVPLTVCLAVVGQHVPQLRFFAVLLSDRSTLSWSEKLYQRLLAGDCRKAQALALDYADKEGLEQFADQLMIPFLRLAERDRDAGVLDEGRAEFVFESARDLIEAVVQAERDKTEPAEETPPDPTLRVLCIAATDEADEIVASLLAEVLAARGVAAEVGAAETLAGEHAEHVARSKTSAVAVSVLPPLNRRGGRYLVRRLRASHPQLPIVIGVWQPAEVPDAFDQLAGDRFTHVVRTVAEAASEIGKIGSPADGSERGVVGESQAPP